MFSLVFSAISDTQVQCRNLQSALLRPGIVAEKIQTELAAGRFAGPFDHPLLPKFQVSPLGLCPKKEPNKLRMIHHGTKIIIAVSEAKINILTAWQPWDI
jgi:hypothetical protein